ncbi:MAG: methyltransferase domain-containing protein [Betaproteobacteria bacterium]|nr:methyltransferase domain-containing protein [Betaproteobacteria bacterium]
MSPEEYDAWYDTPRGAWIGGVEYLLLGDMLAPRAGETVLDVGCGTGHFTRRFAQDRRIAWAAGADIDLQATRHAAGRGAANYVVADARRLPFPDRSFDLVISVTALCFVDDARTALAEMLRVARRRVALGLLNRHSLLWLAKGRGGGRGAYRGAHWHTRRELHHLFAAQPAHRLTLRTAVVLPGGGVLAQCLEAPLRRLAPWAGAFIAASADVA